MGKHSETRKFVTELRRAGFTVTIRKNNHYRVVPPLPFKDQEGALHFMACTPSDHRALKNERAWAERFGLPKKRGN